ncbi:hypothetical protein [Psychrobacter sp.]|uniref:hypothetical protein n=1 Tax=Psychrobacter sp. TaxID=56811 RepID=UPI0035686C7E
MVAANFQKNSNYVIQAQRLDTTIIIPRGQWVTVGQVSQSSQSNQNQRSSYGSNHGMNSIQDIPIWIMAQ